MRLGIFAKTFPRPTLAGVAEAVAGCGLSSVQFNLSCAGLPTLPDRVTAETCDEIRREFGSRGIAIAAISGTFNVIDPDPARRRAGLDRLGVLASICRPIGTSIITLCTGTRDPIDMWRRHPDNDTPAAWRDLIGSLEIALDHAERHDVTLAFEPEIANVIDSAAKARRLLDEVGSLRLKVVFDAANLFHAGELPKMREILTEAVDLLGPDIALAHAKDLNRDGASGDLAAGTGVLDYELYLRLLAEAGYDGPLILHGLSEDQVAASVAFLRGTLGQ